MSVDRFLVNLRVIQEIYYSDPSEKLLMLLLFFIFCFQSTMMIIG